MTLHLLVVGQAPGQASHRVMDDVARLAQERRPDFLVRRCRSPGELVETVAAAATGRKVELLDLFDHGSPGCQRLGAGDLFRSDGDPRSPLLGADIAARLGDHLTETAQVRLLGCSTGGAGLRAAAAAEPPGRLLLIKLGRALGARRVVLATITGVHVSDFTAAGFKPPLELPRLFSSLAALDGAAPTYEARKQNIMDLMHR